MASTSTSRQRAGLRVASASSGAGAVFARSKTTGALTQLAGTAGCVSDDGTGGACADGTALKGASSVVVSPDGKHVYVATAVSNAVAVFGRNKATGALTQLAGTAGCVSEDGTGGGGARGKSPHGARAASARPDGGAARRGGTLGARG